MSQILPAYFISHGGGPWPWLKKEMPFYDKLEATLRDMPRQIGRTPQAILMISAHWEEKKFTVMKSEKPPMIYDYSGFPAHTYQIQYSAPGSLSLANRVEELVRNAGLPVAHDDTRGFDHGMYAPMAAIYPNANVPVVQLSMLSNYDPEIHMRLGRALRPLRAENILIIGSGLSYHNLRNFGPQAAIPSREFDTWLNESLMLSDPKRVEDRLNNWEAAPSARLAHPREDHLIPLMVAFGAAEGEPVARVYHEDDFFGGISVSSFRFGFV